MSEFKKGMVLYCDGSCNPNPGNVGFGVHGYVFEDPSESEGDFKPVIVNSFVVTNNGYVRHTNGKAIVEAPVQVENYYDRVGSKLGIGTNSIAEIAAVMAAMALAIEYREVDTLLIWTDSEYIVNAVLTWSSTWERNGWRKSDGNQVANAELWIEVRKLLAELNDLNIVVSLQWIKGHADLMGNTQADTLSNIGSNSASYGIVVDKTVVTPAKTYHKAVAEKHPLLNYRNVFFNSIEEYNTPGVYCQTNYGDNVGGKKLIIGKRLSAASLSVVKTSKPLEELEVVRNRQYAQSKNINAIINLKLDRVYSKDVYKYLDDFGEATMLKDRRNLNLNFADGKPITLELNPSGLSLRTIESFNYLESILEDFEQHMSGGAFDNRKFYNITDELYDPVVKKGKENSSVLKPSITMTLSKLNIGLTVIKKDSQHHVEIPMMFGFDTLPRNNLKRIEALTPEVYMAVWWESDLTIHYATVVTCSEGLGVWCNPCSNRLFI